MDIRLMDISTTEEIVSVELVGDFDHRVVCLGDFAIVLRYTRRHELQAIHKV